MPPKPCKLFTKVRDAAFQETALLQMESELQQTESIPRGTKMRWRYMGRTLEMHKITLFQNTHSPKEGRQNSIFVDPSTILDPCIEAHAGPVLTA
jgi:hypothetical protein